MQPTGQSYAALLCKLNSVWDQVDQNLFEAIGVRVDDFLYVFIEI